MGGDKKHKRNTKGSYDTLVCMGERIQPGGRVDKETYKQFKTFVRNQHGSVRGNLGRELEKAMTERMNAAQGPDTLTRIENDVATIKAVIAETEHDGGVTAPTVENAESAPARKMSKPAPNQPREKKIEWLIEEMGLDQSGGEAFPAAIRNVVESEYAFSEDTVEEYVNAIFSRLDAERIDSERYYWGDAIDERYEEIEDATDNKFDGVAQ